MDRTEVGMATGRLEDVADGEAFHEALLQAQSDLGLGLVVVEGERITHANEAFVRITGRDRTALDRLGSFFDLVPPDLVGPLREGWALRLAGRTRTDRFDAAVLRPGGDRVDLDVTVKRLPGERFRLVAVVRDVTARKRAEAEHAILLRRLQEERLLLECVLRSIPDALYVADDRGFRLANRAALEELGVPELAAFSRHPAALAERLQARRAESGERLPPEEDVFLQALQGRVAEQEMVVRHGGSGEDRVVRAAAAPIIIEGRILGAVAVHSDITARRRAEEEVRASKERLEELGRARTEFFNTVAHELRTPLTPLLLQLEQLRRASLAPEHRASLDVVDRAVERLNRLLDDILDAARVESGHLSVALEPVDLARLVREAAAVFGPAASQGGVRLSVDAPEALQVQGDPQRLAQVLDNLLSNALKYTTTGGEVRVTMTGGAGEVRVEVRDSGVGLRPEDAAQLFRPFGQVAAPEGGRRGGTGLGLFISKGIVERHGGRMGVASDGPGKGSTFWFLLPRQQPES